MKHKLSPRLLGICFSFGLGTFLASCTSYKTIVPSGTTASPSDILTRIAPGNRIRLVMKNGESIQNMKVEEMNAEDIIGTQPSRDAQDQWIYAAKTVRIAEVREIRKQGFSPGKTLGAILLVPTLLFLLFPPHFESGVGVLHLSWK